MMCALPTPLPGRHQAICGCATAHGTGKGWVRFHRLEQVGVRLPDAETIAFVPVAAEAGPPAAPSAGMEWEKITAIMAAAGIASFTI